MGAGIFSSHSHRPRYRSSSNYCGFTIASKAKSSGTCRRQHSGSRRGRGNCVKLYWSGTTPKTDSSQNAKGLISAGKTEIFTEDESGVTCESWLSDQMNARATCSPDSHREEESIESCDELLSRPPEHKRTHSPDISINLKTKSEKEREEEKNESKKWRSSALFKNSWTSPPTPGRKPINRSKEDLETIFQNYENSRKKRDEKYLKRSDKILLWDQAEKISEQRRLCRADTEIFLENASQTPVSSPSEKRAEGKRHYLIYIDDHVPYQAKTEAERLEAQITIKADSYLCDGYALLHGLNFQKIDTVKGQAFIKRAAALGSHTARGICFEGAYGVEMDLEKALHYFHLAEKKNHPIAHVHLGSLFLAGKGVKKDYIRAVTYYKKASEQRNAAGQRCLGSCYQFGLGVAIDYRKAVRLYKKSATQGYGIASYSLGYCFLKGIGVGRSIDVAYKYFKQSANQDFSLAIKETKHLLDEHPNLERRQDRKSHGFQAGHRRDFPHIRKPINRKFIR
ncbi:hypothetical protein AAMO2058_000785700 [Amorphochlora amoebiformis]